MQNLIVANWKMNPVSLEEAKKLFNSIKEKMGDVKSEVVVCPPFIYLAELKGLTLGAQDIFYEEKGAFTGEVSGEMLKSVGIDYVIIGHSERRKYFSETDEVINEKIKKALGTGLKVIFCIGETQEQHDNEEKYKVLENQIKKGLDGIENLKFKIENLAIAYEPVWAIGTGNNCSVDETKESINFIKNLVPNVRVLYGGSVKSKNSGEYIKNAGANGLLVGGASLNAEEFIKIVKSAE